MFGTKVSDRCSNSCIWHGIEIQKLAHSFPVTLLHDDPEMQKSGGQGMTQILRLYQKYQFCLMS